MIYEYDFFLVRRPPFSHTRIPSFWAFVSPRYVMGFFCVGKKLRHFSLLLTPAKLEKEEEGEQ